MIVCSDRHLTLTYSHWYTWSSTWPWHHTLR